MFEAVHKAKQGTERRMRAGSAGSARREWPSVRCAQTGFTLVAVMVAVFLLAIATERVATVVSHAVQREREERLLMVGRAYARAIGYYYESSPGATKTWPRSLQDLLDDTRYVTVRRYLRETYADPMTGSSTWGLIRAADGGIAGVYSLSTLAPLRVVKLDLGEVMMDVASSYADWRFEYIVPSPVTSAEMR